MLLPIWTFSPDASIINLSAEFDPITKCYHPARLGAHVKIKTGFCLLFLFELKRSLVQSI